MQAALDAVDARTRRGDLPGGQVLGAVRVRLIEIGEAADALPEEVLAGEPALPWSEAARRRDHLAHGAGRALDELAVLAGAGWWRSGRPPRPR